MACVKGIKPFDSLKLGINWGDPIIGTTVLLLSEQRFCFWPYLFATKDGGDKASNRDGKSYFVISRIAEQKFFAKLTNFAE